MTPRVAVVVLAASVATAVAGAQAPAPQHRVAPETLPKPFATPDTKNPPSVIPQPDGAALQLPPGFTAAVYAEGGFKRMRWIAVAPGGDLFATDSDAHTLNVLRDTNHDGVADERHVFAAGLARPFGIAFGAGHVYVANAGSVVRWPYRAGQLEAGGDPQKVAEFPAEPGHWTRTLAFAPDGRELFVTVGSSSDAGAPDADRGLIFAIRPDGSGKRVVATGLRNTVGLAFHPRSRELWATVQERDKLGDHLVPDYFARVRQGAFYGWPFAYSGPHEDPRHAGERPDLVQKAVVPDVLLEAHSAVMGLAFYDGRAFPKEYRGDAFAAMHGSSNRSDRTGYKVVRIRFRNGRPVGGYDDFVSGWMLGADRKDVWGRPVGVAVAADGSLLVSDDGQQRIWRITYGG